MYICICHAVTESQVRAAARTGVRRLADLRRSLGLAGQCGHCARHALELLREAQGICASGAAAGDRGACAESAR